MNNKNSGLKFTCILSTFVIGALAMAGGKEVGNGGDGYVDDYGKIHVLDLVESGVEDDPYLSEEIEPLPFIQARVNRALMLMPQAPLALLTRKISHIYQLDQIMAYNLLYALEAYSWKPVKKGKLMDISDEDSILDVADDIFDEPDRKLVQLAIRREKSIHYDLNYWEKDLNDVGRTALLLHELAYALMPPQDISLDGKTYQMQSSYTARSIVGYVFSRELALFGRERLVQVAAVLTGPNGVFKAETLKSPYSETGRTVLMSDHPRTLLYSLANNSVASKFHSAMDRVAIEAEVALVCLSKRWERDKFRHGIKTKFLIFPRVAIGEFYSLPGFATYTGLGGKKRIYFKRATWGNDLLIHRLYDAELAQAGGGGEVDEERCKEVSLMVLESQWEYVFGSPFPSAIPQSESRQPRSKKLLNRR